MTDPDGPPSELDEVVVTGQRARGPSPFAELQYPSKGNSTGGEQQQEVGDGNDPGTTPERLRLTKKCSVMIPKEGSNGTQTQKLIKRRPSFWTRRIATTTSLTGRTGSLEL